MNESNFRMPASVFLAWTIGLLSPWNARAMEPPKAADISTKVVLMVVMTRSVGIPGPELQDR